MWNADRPTHRGGLRFFFRLIFPVVPARLVLKMEFLLLYMVPGLSLESLEGMGVAERERWMSMLTEQKEAEAKTFKR